MACATRDGEYASGELGYDEASLVPEMHHSASLVPEMHHSAETCPVAQEALNLLYGINASKSKIEAMATASGCNCFHCQAVKIDCCRMIFPKAKRGFTDEELKKATQNSPESPFWKFLLAKISQQRWRQLQAISLFKELAEKGFAIACLFLAKLPYQAIPLDEVEFYLKKAHELGAYSATMILGKKVFDRYKTVVQNDPALAFFQIVEQTGFPHALRRLAVWNHEDPHGPRILGEAMRLYRLAAQQGDAKANHQLGLIFKEGKESHKDVTEAEKHFRLAADKGYPDAQVELGWMYKEGEGVCQDNVEAIRWFRLAAEQGNKMAQLQLALHS